MNKVKYLQILKVLESNDTRCTDDKADREALAIALIKELFPNGQIYSNTNQL